MITKEDYLNAKIILTKDEYKNALNTVREYEKQEYANKILFQSKCKHIWVEDGDWGGSLEGNTHCSECGVSHPHNYY